VSENGISVADERCRGELPCSVDERQGFGDVRVRLQGIGICPGTYHETHNAEKLRRDESIVSNQSVCFGHYLSTNKNNSSKTWYRPGRESGVYPTLGRGNDLANKEIFAMARVYRSSHQKTSRRHPESV
jgi:hypothetical protein